jgi:hypothetical protein
MKTKGRISNKMKEVSGAAFVVLRGEGVKIEEVTKLPLLPTVSSAFFDVSKDKPIGFPIDFQLSIPNQIAPTIKTSPKTVRMFLVKKDSIFFCCSLFGLSSSRGRLEY